MGGAFAKNSRQGMIAMGVLQKIILGILGLWFAYMLATAIYEAVKFKRARIGSSRFNYAREKDGKIFWLLFLIQLAVLSAISALLIWLLLQ